MLARLNGIDGVESSSASVGNPEGTLVRVSLRPGADSAKIAAEVQRVFSEAVKDHLLYTMAGVAVFVVIFMMFVRTKFGRRVFDKFKLKMPVVGPVISKVAISRFTRTLGTLVSSGVPILQALTIVKETAGNVIIGNAVNSVHESVKEGETITAPLEASGVFPPMVIASTSVMSEGLFVALSLVVVVCALAYRAEGRVRWLALSGLALGCATLTRPIGAVLVLPAALIAFTGPPAPRRWVAALAATGLAIAPCLAWEIRDVTVMSHVIPLTTQDGYFLAGTERDSEQEVRHGQGPWFEREERQAVRGPAQEGHEQVPGRGDLQLGGVFKPRRQEQRLEPEQEEQRQRERREQGPEGGGRTEGREEVRLGLPGQLRGQRRVVRQAIVAPLVQVLDPVHADLA